jgi:hypothetical protein
VEGQRGGVVGCGGAEVRRCGGEEVKVRRCGGEGMKGCRCGGAQV